jgi:hypothetical protein
MRLAHDKGISRYQPCGLFADSIHYTFGISIMLVEKLFAGATVKSKQLREELPVASLDTWNTPRRIARCPQSVEQCTFPQRDLSDHCCH